MYSTIESVKLTQAPKSHFGQAAFPCNVHLEKDHIFNHISSIFLLPNVFRGESRRLDFISLRL